MTDWAPPVPPNTPRPSSPAEAVLPKEALPSGTLKILDKQLSEISLRRTPEESDNNNEFDKHAVGMEKVITIAISGASSSGKTTLAILLTEIFKSGPSSSGALLVHQDDWFRKKRSCERVTYPAKREDVEFCLASCCLSKDSDYRIAPKAEGRFSIRGPDTDSISAINFWGLRRQVMYAKAKGSLPRLDEGKSAFAAPAASTEAIKAKYSHVIKEGRQVIAKWAVSQAKTNESKKYQGVIVHQSPFDDVPRIQAKLLFLEGFLLYENPDYDTPFVDDTEDEATTLNLNFSYGRMGMITDVEKQKADDAYSNEIMPFLQDKKRLGLKYTDIEKEVLLHHMGQYFRKGMKKLQPLMDIKLFLPTTFETAKARRMSRVEYRDEPAGLRHPGQMWKTAGYFEYVAWRNHVLHHARLINFEGKPKPTVKDGVGKNQILVREPVDASVEVTLKWAVDHILKELTTMENCAYRTQNEKLRAMLNSAVRI